MDGVTDRPESFEQLNHVFDRKAPVHGCRCVRGLLFMNSQDNSGKYIDFFTVKLLTSDEGLYKFEFDGMAWQRCF